MRTILHIGQHKTGTTSLQFYLKKNRKKLINKGLYVPECLVGIDHPSHYILNVYSLDSRRLSPMKEVLLKRKSPDYFRNLEERLTLSIERHYEQAYASNCSDIVWTNEGLYLLNSIVEYEKLKHLFQKFSNEIICICCFREKKSFRQSYMQQLKKQGLSFSLDEDSYRYVELKSWLFDYDRKKDILNNVFQDSIYLSYNEDDMIKTFLMSIGYDLVAATTGRLNITSKA